MSGSGLVSWFDPGQNRESGGQTAESTAYAGYAAAECGDPGGIGAN